MQVCHVLSANTFSCTLSHHIRTDPEQNSALVCVPVVTSGDQLEGVVLPAERKNTRATFGPVGSLALSAQSDRRCRVMG